LKYGVGVFLSAIIRMKFFAALCLIVVNTVPLTGNAEVLEINYDGFTVWLDCDRRGATAFRYRAVADSGSHKRNPKFSLDPDIPKRCQQTVATSYKRPKGENSYDRGHLVPANHFDGSKRSINQTNFMPNILPQAANMNRGAWLQTEEIIECYRDLEPLEVWGGVLWGNNSEDDHFLASHGVKTPDGFWKVIIRGGRGIAWIVPNSPKAKRRMLDKYLVSIEEIELLSGLSFNIPKDQKSKPISSSWQVPKGCDKG
jgi:endonuclease G, mitochondrial